MKNETDFIQIKGREGKAQLLPHGNRQAGEVARQLGMSRRTLTRRLSSEGLTFAGVLQRLKSDLAKRHLTDKSLSPPYRGFESLPLRQLFQFTLCFS
jgi:hypothetical protein